MFLKVFKQKETDLLKKCIDHIGGEFNEENLQLFLTQNFTFFVGVFNDEDKEAKEIMGFCWGYILPSPEGVTPTIFIKCLDVLTGHENKGVMNYLISNLQVVFFFEKPYSSILVLIEKEYENMCKLFKGYNAEKLENHNIFIIQNPNVDENGIWKGIPEDGIASLNVIKD